MTQVVIHHLQALIPARLLAIVAAQILIALEVHQAHLPAVPAQTATKQRNAAQERVQLLVVVLRLHQTKKDNDNP